MMIMIVVVVVVVVDEKLSDAVETGVYLWRDGSDFRTELAFDLVEIEAIVIGN